MPICTVTDLYWRQIFSLTDLYRRNVSALDDKTPSIYLVTTDSVWYFFFQLVPRLFIQWLFCTLTDLYRDRFQRWMTRHHLFTLRIQFWCINEYKDKLYSDRITQWLIGRGDNFLHWWTRQHILPCGDKLCTYTDTHTDHTLLNLFSEYMTSAHFPTSKPNSNIYMLENIEVLLYFCRFFLIHTQWKHLVRWIECFAKIITENILILSCYRNVAIGYKHRDTF